MSILRFPRVFLTGLPDDFDSAFGFSSSDVWLKIVDIGATGKKDWFEVDACSGLLNHVLLFKFGLVSGRFSSSINNRLPKHLFFSSSEADSEFFSDADVVSVSALFWDKSFCSWEISGWFIIF